MVMSVRTVKTFGAPKPLHAEILDRLILAVLGGKKGPLKENKSHLGQGGRGFWIHSL